jgi:hypothetical protein
MNEEEKKLQAKAQQQDKRIKKLVTENQELADKVATQDEQIGKLQADGKEKEKLHKRIKGKADKYAGTHRVDQMVQDGAGSTIGQVLSAGEQALLDYLIETFPETAGAHKVAIKAIPPAAALIWYLYEIYSMKKQATLGKRVRMQAANVLGNLGFVYLAQTYWRDRGDGKQMNKQLAQENVSLDAKNQKLQEELASMNKRLKDAGLA